MNGCPKRLQTGGCHLSYLFVQIIVLTWGTSHWFAPRSLDPLDQLIEESRPAWQRGLRRVARAVLVSYGITLVLGLAVLPLVAARYHLVAPVGLLIGPIVVLLTSAALVVGPPLRTRPSLLEATCARQTSSSSSGRTLRMCGSLTGASYNARSPAAADRSRAGGGDRRRLVGIEGRSPCRAPAECRQRTPGGLLRDAVHSEKVTIGSSRHQDFTQESPRKLLPTRTQEAQRRRREKL